MVLEFLKFYWFFYVDILMFEVVVEFVLVVFFGDFVCVEEGVE